MAGAIDKRLEPGLSAIAVKERLGGWVLTLDVDAKVKQLLSEVPALMRAGLSLRPGDYSSDELFALDGVEQALFLARHRRLKALGLVEIEKVGVNDGVRCIAFGVGGEISGFSDRLVAEVAQNVAKLREAAPREGHLAVLSYDFQASRLPEKTSPPHLPSGVDFLWVIHSWPQTPGLIEVWVARRGVAAWQRSRVPSDVVPERTEE